MTRRKQTRSSRSARSVNWTKQTSAPIANGVTRPVRKPTPLAEPFYVAVDRQLKSGYETYEAAEKAALKIKDRSPRLHVTVFDVKEGRHKLIELPRTGTTNRNRLAKGNAGGRPKAAVS